MEKDSVGEEVSLWQKMMQYPDSWAEGTLPLRSTMERPKGKWGQHRPGPSEKILWLKMGRSCGGLRQIRDCGLISLCKLIRPEACLLKWTSKLLIGYKQTHSSLTCWTLNIDSHLPPCMWFIISNPPNPTPPLTAEDWCNCWKCAKASHLTLDLF